MSATEIKPRLSAVAISIGAFLPEKNIFADTAGERSAFRYKDNRRPLSIYRTDAGGEFLWLLCLRTRCWPRQGFGAVRDSMAFLIRTASGWFTAIAACAQSSVPSPGSNLQRSPAALSSLAAESDTLIARMLPESLSIIG